ncbi:hypothetical protein BU16DRAFT_565893 [Lophium mytilinum]|uniref:Uncharacterized protein n=1 Tax=Lophium mytilinum TaxID=390894 RepID=A0A6A6QFT1_9PEZI|nr:hypothetical protein BU16DRAFT_565893 [Lophium mytilinum]
MDCNSRNTNLSTAPTPSFPKPARKATSLSRDNNGTLKKEVKRVSFTSQPPTVIDIPLKKPTKRVSFIDGPTVHYIPRNYVTAVEEADNRGVRSGHYLKHPLEDVEERAERPKRAAVSCTAYFRTVPAAGSQ